MLTVLEKKELEELREYKNRPLALLLGIDKPYEERSKAEKEHAKELQQLCIELYRLKKKRFDHNQKMKQIDKRFVQNN